jgi:heat-inducible transcriptional repressor
VPTEGGYRFYAAVLLQDLDPRPGPFPLDLTNARSEVDAALEATTEMLSEVTHLVALVSAPPLASTSVRHVEVLLPQPQVVVVVVITSTGGVTKRAYAFSEPVDAGVVNWAAEYLNERVAGASLGANLVRRCFEDPGLAPREGAFLAAIRSAFTELVTGEGERLFVGSAAGLLESANAGELEGYRRVLELLEKRAALLAVVKQTLDPRRPFVRVGDELEHPALHDLALVGASYGLANRSLGAVSLLGPVRMDYDKAIRSVRAAAHELSRFVEEIYEEN